MDLVAVAESQFSTLEKDSLVTTILEVFQRPERCSTLNVPLTCDRPQQKIGIQRLLVWGEHPAILLGDTAVLPFVWESTAAMLLTTQGAVPFTWEFVLANMTYHAPCACGSVPGLSIRTATDGECYLYQPGLAQGCGPTKSHCNRPVTCQAPRATRGRCYLRESQALAERGS